MDDDNTPRFSPEDRIPDVPANDPIPPGELMDARYFLSGWTLKRYTSRFRRESKEEGETECADDEGDGVTPVGPGAFGWTPEGPPGRRAGRRRPHGVLTIPTRATVGQVRYALGFLSFPRFFRPDPTAPSPGSARPRRRERARGARGGRSHGRIRRLDQRRVVAPADTAGDVPGALGPGVCISGRVKCTHSCVFLSCLSWTWFRCDVLYHRPVCDCIPSTTPAKRRETGRCKEKQKHTTLHPATSLATRPYPPEDIEAGADELVPSSPAPRTRRDALDAFAATNATNTWLKLSRPGDDGDTCYLGFADTTLLDFVSRGLDARELEDKRVGDFDPSHRIAVFTEPESESSSKANGHGDSSDEDDDSYVPDMRPRWVSVVSQLDVLDLMVQDPDLLGTFPRTATMESLGLTRGVFSVAAVTSDFSVAGCFALMHNLKVSGVAVLDRHGRFMIGSISASDVRRVTCANDLADELMSTVGEFLRDRVWSKIPGRENQRHARPILFLVRKHIFFLSASMRRLTGRCVQKIGC